MKIERGYPSTDGLYMAYLINPAIPNRVKPYAMLWKRGGWYFAGSGTGCNFTVSGWVGPLPEYSEPSVADFDL